MSVVKIVKSIRKEVSCFSAAVDKIRDASSSLYEYIYSLVSEIIDRFIDERIAEISKAASDTVANAAYYLGEFIEDACQELSEATSVAVANNIYIQQVKTTALLPKHYGMVFSLIAEKFRTAYLQRHQDRGKSHIAINDSLYTNRSNFNYFPLIGGFCNVSSDLYC